MRHQFKLSSVLLFTLVIFTLFPFCGPKAVNSDIIGQWRAVESPVIVREKVDGKFQFSRGMATAELMVSNTNTVTGTIGEASFSNAQIVPNRGLPSDITGVKYIIKCDLQGKIYQEVPVEYRDVELWVNDPVKDDSFSAELRYTKGMAHFPMSKFNFERVKP